MKGQLNKGIEKKPKENLYFILFYFIFLTHKLVVRKVMFLNLILIIFNKGESVYIFIKGNNQHINTRQCVCQYVHIYIGVLRECVRAAAVFFLPK
jgi:hypothetical protein